MALMFQTIGNKRTSGRAPSIPVSRKRIPALFAAGCQLQPSEANLLPAGLTLNAPLGSLHLAPRK